MRAETKDDLKREQKAIRLLAQCAKAQGWELSNIRKGGKWGIDFIATMTAPGGHQRNKVIEVKGMNYGTVAKPAKLLLAARKWVKLDDIAKKHKADGVLVWALEDGIIWINHNQVQGGASYTGRKDRNLINDQEPIISVDPIYCKRALYEHNGTQYGG